MSIVALVPGISNKYNVFRSQNNTNLCIFFGNWVFAIEEK